MGCLQGEVLCWAQVPIFIPTPAVFHPSLSLGWPSLGKPLSWVLWCLAPRYGGFSWDSCLG